MISTQLEPRPAVIYSGKDSIRFQKTHDKKKEEVKPKISGEKNVSRNIFRVLIHFVK